MADLPAELSGFVGRRAELAQVKRLLSGARLVTLTGPGGVGKTRLALQVGRMLERAFPDGVRFVDLSAVEDPALVPNAVAAALALPDTSRADIPAVLEVMLANSRALLVLDNCEQVVAATAALGERLLSGAPVLRLLVTSRERLGVLGEQVLPVPPLGVPAGQVSLGQALESDAVALFVERASAAAPDFRLTADNYGATIQLCQRLDGLPLAIELAAARVPALSVEQILARLDSPVELLRSGNRAAPARQQTLEAAVAWSFELCSEPERELWTRLSVFSGTFDLEAAESVAEGDVLDGLANLVDKSVLLCETDGARARYRMLETIRGFGRKRLVERGDEPARRRRHRDHYLARVRQDAQDWFGPGQADRLERCRLDLPDLWAALAFSLGESEEAGSGADLACEMWWFWIARAVRDGRFWLDQVPSARSDEQSRARCINGWLAIAQGDAPSATRLLDGRSQGVAVLRKAVADYRALGTYDPTSALAWCNLPTVALLLGDLEGARALCQDWILMCGSAGEEWARSWALWVLAIVRWRQGETDPAQEHAVESLRLKRSLADALGTPPALSLLARFATVRGGAEQGAFLFGAADALWEPLGRPAFGWGTFRDWADQWRAATVAALGARAFEGRYDAGRAADLDTAVALALGETRARDLQGLSPLRSAPTQPPTPVELPQLTRREVEVAKLIAEGRSNKEIAESLVISQRTAETHVANILAKLGFGSRAQVAAWVSRQ